MRLAAVLWCAVPLPAVALAQSPVPERLSLGEAVQRGAGAALPVVEADAMVREAAARRDETRAGLFPDLSGSAGYVNRTFNIHTFGLEFPTVPGTPPFPDLVGPFTVTDARATLRQAVVDFSTLARIRSSGGAVQVSQAARSVAAEQAAERTALAYLGAVRAEAIVAARQADLDLAERLAALSQAQLEAGLSPGIDVTRARTQVAGARGLLLVAENNRSRAEIELARSMGVDPARRFLLTDTLAATLARSEAPEEQMAARQLARERRPDLALERAMVQHASLEKGAIKSERLPRLEVEGDAGFSGTSFTSGLATRQVALALTLPLFDGLRRESRIAEQNAIIDAATARERDTEQQLDAEVDAALLDLASAGEQERVALEGLSLAEDEVAQAEERFQSGVAGNIEVINAQSSLLRARDALIDARTAGATARIRLARATGMAETIR